MPALILDRIPLPNLRLYTTISVLLVSSCLYYAITSTSDPLWRLQNNTTTTITPSILTQTAGDGPSDHLAGSNDKINNADESNHNILDTTKSMLNSTRTFSEHFKDIFSFMSQEPFCIWVSTSQFVYIYSNVYICLYTFDRTVFAIYN